MNLEDIAIPLIVAALVAGGTGYVSIRVMETKINGMREKMTEMDREIQGIRQRLHDWSSTIGWAQMERNKDKDFTDRYIT